MSPGVISNFISIGKDLLNDGRIRHDILANQKKGRFDIALFQHLQQARGVFRTWPVVESHCDVWLVNMGLKIGGRFGRRRSGIRSGRSILSARGQRAKNGEEKGSSKTHSVIEIA